MTYIKAEFNAMNMGASQLKSGATELQATEEMQMRQIIGSADYWSDVAGGEGSLGATGQQWRMRSDASHTEATQRGTAVDASQQEYAGGLQQVVGIISQFNG
ncbi:hypothetical protein [Kribbella sp. NPDC055071]|jgi:hypothetical protein